MARPPIIRDDAILAAARELFLEKGIRATTAEVARRAGVAEGTVFNRFPTKAALFHAAMLPEGGEPAWVRELVSRVGVGDVRETLIEIGGQMIVFFRSFLPLIMMSWSNPGTADAIPSPFTGPNPLPIRALKLLASYFEQEMRAGRMRRHDPEILARVYIGSVIHYVFFEVVLAARHELPLPETTYLRGLAELLWSGLAVPAPVAQKVSRDSGTSRRRKRGE